MLVRLRSHFPGALFESCTPKNHTNVVKLTHGGRALFAKYTDTPHDRSFETEVTILKMLPPWWGLHYVDSFQCKGQNIIITNRLCELPWQTYDPSENAKYVEVLTRQLNWLHSQGIVHADLALKNILNTPSGPVIIDFDRCIHSASEHQMRGDWKCIYNSFNSMSVTQELARLLSRACPFPSRASASHHSW
jgi:RIO-like serine/threonine protein kinase